MTEDGGRPQDQGRRHRRRVGPTPETTSLLADWHATMRAELRAIVEALGARKTGLMKDLDEPLIPLDDARRDRLVDRGVKVARELGGEVDPGGPASVPSVTTDRPRVLRPTAFGPDR